MYLSINLHILYRRIQQLRRNTLIGKKQPCHHNIYLLRLFHRFFQLPARQPDDADSANDRILRVKLNLPILLMQFFNLLVMLFKQLPDRNSAKISPVGIFQTINKQINLCQLHSSYVDRYLL